MADFPKETIQANEPAIMQTIVDATIAMQKKNYVPGTVARRDVHTKSHGTYDATFTVLTGIPSAQRVGLFATSASYPATVRLSNGAPGISSDIRPNVRGMGLKVRNVPGVKLLTGDEDATCVDFLLANHPTSFHTVLEDYPGVQALMSVGNLKGVLKQYPVEGKLILHAVLKLVKNPCNITYHSQTPYCLGDGAIKYQLVPNMSWWQRICSFFSFPNVFDGDYLRHAAEKTLRKRPVKFTLCVRLQTEQDSIENSSTVWHGALVPVAELVIHPIGWDVPESAGEGLTFNPWRMLAAHRPLGWVNRVRENVYRADFAWRTAVNAALAKLKG